MGGFISTTLENYLIERQSIDKSVNYWVKYVLSEISFIEPVRKTLTKKPGYRTLKVYFSKTDKETNNKLKEKLEDLSSTLLENGIMISFFVNYADVEVYFKQINVKIEPTRYVYHSSPVTNRDSILKNGLLPKSSKESREWAYSFIYSYPKAIFATMVNLDTGIINPWKSGGGIDIWRIDTNGLDNEWVIDLNYVGEKENQHIMTFQPIPPEHLELVKEG